MKLATPTKRVHADTMTPVDEGDFTIKANGKAFDILLDGIYSNKVRAAIRELWSNAWDSHVEAGIPEVPFKTQLPSMLDPNFVVRDFGVSLSHDDVMHLYTTLFDSSKTETNEAVGAFGLGSKAPFAYTDTFTVTAFLDGKKRVYMVYRADDRTPRIRLMSESASDEPRGLEVSFPVNHNDFAEFELEARELAVGFVVKPDAGSVTFNDVEPLMAHDNWSLYPRFAFGNSSSVWIRQGCVIYPLPNWEWANRIDAVAGSIVVDVPIGSVSITASRESVSLDNQTRDFLASTLDRTNENIKAHIEAKFAECKNTLEAARLYSLVPGIRFVPHFNGRVVSPIVELKGGSRWEPMTVKSGNQRDLIKLNRVDVRSSDRFKFVVWNMDVKLKRAMMRYRDFVAEERARGNHSVYLLKNPTPRQLERLMTLGGIKREQIINIASLPDPGPASSGKRSKGSGGLTGAYELHGTCEWAYRVSDYSTPISELPQGDFLWVQIDRINSRRDAFTNERAQAEILRRITGKNYKLVGLTAGAVKRTKVTNDNKLSDVWTNVVNSNKEAYTAATLDYTRYLSTPPQLQPYLFKDGCPEVKMFKGVFDSNGHVRAIPAYELSFVDSDKSDEAVREWRESLAEKYPLLLDSHNAEAVEWYMAARDAALGND